MGVLTVLRRCPLFAGTVVLAGVVLGGSSVGASAQEVSGEILDAETGRPVAEARIVVRNATDSVLSEIRTDASGLFRMLGLPEGPLDLYVEALGYATSASREIDHRGQALFLEIDLAPDPLDSDGITVSAEYRDPYLASRGFYERERRGHGYFLTPNRISMIRPSDMFRRIASIRVSHGEPVFLRGAPSVRRCRPAVYQDGTLVRSEQSRTPFDGAVAPPAWIEAVEVYPGPASAPVEWRGSASCGLILVWTR